MRTDENILSDAEPEESLNHWEELEKLGRLQLEVLLDLRDLMIKTNQALQIGGTIEDPRK